MVFKSKPYKTSKRVKKETQKEAVDKNKNTYISMALHYTSAVFALVMCLSVRPSVCLPVCLSVTSQCSIKTARRRITSAK